MKEKLIGIGLIVAIAAIYAIGERVILAKGNSVPGTVYIKVNSRNIEQYDYVTFEYSHPIISDKPAKLTKRVSCAEGQRLEMKEHYFYCNGQYLGGYLKETWDKRPLTPFKYNGKVPQGKLFVSSVEERSFDSRYFGFIEKRSATKVQRIF